MTDLWQQLCHRSGVGFDEIKDAAMNRYIDLLLDANARMNLTRISTREDATVKHIGDALTLLPLIPAGAIHVVDVGSGGGIPGIPLAIVRPDVKIALLESVRKKADFLKSVVATMNLSNVEVINARVEDLSHSARRGSFDVVTARALAPMNILLEWCIPLIKKTGRVLAQKGEKVSAELIQAERAIKQLGAGRPIVHPVILPGVDHHVIVEIARVGSTPLRYPRNPQQVNASPL